MGRIDKRTLRGTAVALLLLVVVGALTQGIFISLFNERVHTVMGTDATQATYVDLHNRDDATSSWVKRDFNLNGQKVDLKAQTLDGTFYNNSDDLVESWRMTIQIGNDCFMNNAWVGTVEIHQFVGTDKEAVQTLDLRNYEVDDVKLEHLYDGDLLIPLQKGDYVVYFPSEKDNELQVAPRTELTMGMIFYFTDELELADYQLDYRYHRGYTYGIGFIAIVVLAVLLVLLLAGVKVADLSYGRAMKDMELRRSGLSYMSGIYSIIYFVDLEKDELTPVYADEKTTEKLPKGRGAREQMRKVFGQDTDGAYREVVLEFIDIATLPERLERETIACEYVSKAYGWSQLRFFAVEREQGEPLKRVLLTIQDINEEKRELDRIEERVAQAEFESRTRSAFVEAVSKGMRTSVQAIFDLSEAILHKSEDEETLASARKIKSRSRMLAFMIDSAVDSSHYIAEGLEPARVEYSFYTLMSDVCDIAATMVEGKPVSFETDVSSAVPERLIGDALRIERVLMGLLSYSARCAESGAIKLSVFGKEREKTEGTEEAERHEGPEDSAGSEGSEEAKASEHLLFSVKVEGYGMSEVEFSNLSDFLAAFGTNVDQAAAGRIQELEATAMQLHFMDSELHVINAPGEECELYFEIEQGVPDEDRAEASSS